MKPFEVHPLTANRWQDFEWLFGPRGACAGCWCMFWKLPRKEFDAGKYETNRKAQKGIVEGGQIPGLIAYNNDSAKTKPPSSLDHFCCSVNGNNSIEELHIFQFFFIQRFFLYHRVLFTKIKI